MAQEGKSSYERSTFVIDADGNVARIMRRVNPDSHADEVLAALGTCLTARNARASHYADERT